MKEKIVNVIKNPVTWFVVIWLMCVSYHAASNTAYIGRQVETVGRYALPRHYEIIDSDRADALTAQEDSLVYLQAFDFKKVFLVSDHTVLVCPTRDIYLVRMNDTNWVVAQMWYFPKENHALDGENFSSWSSQQASYPEPGVRLVTAQVTLRSYITGSFMVGTGILLGLSVITAVTTVAIGLLWLICFEPWVKCFKKFKERSLTN